LSHSHQWKDYVSHGPPAYDAFDHDDPKSWGPARHSYERQAARVGGGGGHHHHSTHSLPRGSGGLAASSNSSHNQAAYSVGYSSYDRRSGGFQSRPPASDYPPDHYFMPSQRKYSGEVLRVYVDYNK
jgi:hypothetical protein